MNPMTQREPGAAPRTARWSLVLLAVLWFAPPSPHAVSPPARRAKQPSPARSFWWTRFPTFSQVAGDPALVRRIGARMDIHGFAIDPTWGPYTRRLTSLDSGGDFRLVKKSGVRAIAWIEGFGDCMTYALAFERGPDGSFPRRADDPAVARASRSHWNWAVPGLPRGNAFRWAGPHNTVNDEDFVLPLFSLARSGVPVPTYPDGRPAVGWIPGARYPLNARLYDACGSKDINGALGPSFEAPAGVNEIDPATGTPKGPTEGLYPAIAGRDDVALPPGAKPGDPVHCGVISVHKDLSAPFWTRYARTTIRDMARRGIDGVWCDNYSPWDNFGYPPVRKAFGDWSVHRFHRAFRSEMPRRTLRGIGITRPETFDIRNYLKAKARTFGAKDPSRLDDPAWSDARWLDDPVWRRFKAFRQKAAREDLKSFYEAIHEEARKEGRPDFCIAGNDIPFYGLGWVRDEWLDMVSTEITPGWHMGSGSRGIMIPPLGKMAVVYRVALEHQKGPFAGAWYYLNDRYAAHQKKPGIARVLLAEAFANHAFLECDPNNPAVAGDVETHARWNRFIRENERRFGHRTARAGTGILFSPDCQLAQLAPGGFPDMDRQPHIFGHYGWATAMIDAHIPYRVVVDWKLDARRLAGLRAFIVPDAEALDAKAARALETWVRAGGTLVVTGPSGIREGPVGFFARRRASILESLTGPVTARDGRERRRSGDPVRRRRVGKGLVLYSPRPLGMDYYLRSGERPRLLSRLRQMAGPPADVDGSGLPSTVGLFPWESAAGGAVFADLVNYDFDAGADRVRPARDVAFRLRLPKGVRSARAVTLSPDGNPPARVAVSGNWAIIRLPRLTHYASVKLESR